MEVYKRVYTDEQIEDLSDTEREAFEKKRPKFDKALRSRLAATEKRRGGAPPTKKPSKNKSDAKKEDVEEGTVGDEPSALPPKKEKPAPHVWEEEGESEFSPIPASSLVAPRSPFRRLLGIGAWKKKN